MCAWVNMVGRVIAAVGRVRMGLLPAAACLARYPSLTASVISRILRNLWGDMIAILAMEVCGKKVMVSLGLVTERSCRASCRTAT